MIQSGYSDTTGSWKSSRPSTRNPYAARWRVTQVQIADKIDVGFELPNSTSASVVPNVPKMTVEQAEQAVA